MNNFIIAIDGTSASGKGTIAFNLAEYYNFKYLDTGLSYRAIAYFILEKNIEPENEKAILNLAENLNFDILTQLNLHTYEIGNLASKVAVIPVLREILVQKQRNFALKYKTGVILDGRDIGTVVCPDAKVKFYIDADVKIRSQRRYDSLKKQDNSLTLEDITQQLNKRDERDKHREVGALKQAEGAYLIDTSNLTIEETLEKTKTIINYHLNDSLRCK